MSETNICEKCGAEMLPIDPTNPVGLKCPNCGWGWAITFIDPIYNDQINYSVFLLEGNEQTKENIKVVSKVTNLNMLQARKIIESTPYEIFSGKAVNVKAVIELLRTQSLSFKVEPEFPY